ncbi:MAG: aminoglycoside phosphotransferase family protein, partial [Chloroflexota bacterium]
MESNLGLPLTYGRTAEIYAWQDDQVIKLFHDWFALKSIEYEAKLAKAAYASGLPVPAVGDIIQVNGRNGLIYQRVNGSSIENILLNRPWACTHYAKKMAELHARLHNNTNQVELPDQRQRFIDKIERAKVLSSQLKVKVLTKLESMPDDHKICHGDFHPGNILTSTQGETVVDWIDASIGNPLADLARSTILILGGTGANLKQGVTSKFVTRLFHATYVRHYFKLRPEGKRQYKTWIPIVAAARLSENIP